MLVRNAKELRKELERQVSLKAEVESRRQEDKRRELDSKLEALVCKYEADLTLEVWRVSMCEYIASCNTHFDRSRAEQKYFQFYFEYVPTFCHQRGNGTIINVGLRAGSPSLKQPPA